MLLDEQQRTGVQISWFHLDFLDLAPTKMQPNNHCRIPNVYFFYKQNMQLLKCDDIAQFQPPTEHCFADET